MDKFELIEKLEGKWVPGRKAGTWHKIQDRCVNVGLGWFPLINYEIGELEIWLENARDEEPENE